MRWREIIRENQTPIDQLVRSVEIQFPDDVNRINLARRLGQKELVWAQTNLKKPDRITWYMDYFSKFILNPKMDPEDIVMLLNYIESQIKNQLLYFLDLKIPAIQNAAWQPGEDILARFSKLEKEYWSEKRGDLRHMWSEKAEPIHVDKWPLTMPELRELEKTIFQTPSWLAYWERFGWTSWQWMTCNWHYNRNKQTAYFSEVPGIWSSDGQTVVPERMSLEFDLKAFDWSSERGPVKTLNGQLVEVAMPAAVQLIRRWINQNLSGKNLEYLNGKYYVRFGLWRSDERSKNWLASQHAGHDVWEIGVSAYHAEWDVTEKRWDIGDGIDGDTINGTVASLMTGRRKIFLVQGRELQQDGADGEPLLKDIKLIKELSITDICFPGVFDPREDDLRETIMLNEYRVAGKFIDMVKIFQQIKKLVEDIIVRNPGDTIEQLEPKLDSAIQKFLNQNLILKMPCVLVDFIHAPDVMAHTKMTHKNKKLVCEMDINYPGIFENWSVAGDFKKFAVTVASLFCHEYVHYCQNAEKFHKIKFGDIDRIVQQSNAYHDDKMDYWSHVEEISAYAAEAAIQLRQFYEPEFIVRQARNRPSELTGKSTAFDTYYQLLRNGRKNLYDKFIDELIREF